MTLNDKIIERWLEEDLSSNEEECFEEQCSEHEADIDENFVLSCDSASDTEIEGDEMIDAPQESATSQPLVPNPDSSSSDDEVPLSQLRSRTRKKNYYGKIVSFSLVVL